MDRKECVIRSQPDRAADISPPFQRWVKWRRRKVPSGTKEMKQTLRAHLVCGSQGPRPHDDAAAQGRFLSSLTGLLYPSPGSPTVGNGGLISLVPAGQGTGGCKSGLPLRLPQQCTNHAHIGRYGSLWESADIAADKNVRGPGAHW